MVRVRVRPRVRVVLVLMVLSGLWLGVLHIARDTQLPRLHAGAWSQRAHLACRGRSPVRVRARSTLAQPEMRE